MCDTHEWRIYYKSNNLYECFSFFFLQFWVCESQIHSKARVWFSGHRFHLQNRMLQIDEMKYLNIVPSMPRIQPVRSLCAQCMEPALLCFANRILSAHSIFAYEPVTQIWIVDALIVHETMADVAESCIARATEIVNFINVHIVEFDARIALLLTQHENNEIWIWNSSRRLHSCTPMLRLNVNVFVRYSVSCSA